MRRPALAVAALLLAACAYHGPTSPTPVPSGSGGSAPPPSTPPSLPDPPPLAVSLSFGPNPPTKDQRVAFSAMVLTGPAPTAPTVYAFTFGDGGTAQSADGLTSHVYGRDGEYDATVTLSDAAGRTATAAAHIRVLNPPAPPSPPAPLPAPVPTLAATLACTAATPPAATSCNLNGLTYGSTPIASTAVTNVDWEWGDGTPNAPTVVPYSSHGYAQVGTYDVAATVTATTADGPKTATARATVSVK